MEWHLCVLLGLVVGAFAAFGFAGFAASEMLFPLVALVGGAGAGYACGRFLWMVKNLLSSVF